jgi:hypothetical protein
MSKTLLDELWALWAILVIPETKPRLPVLFNIVKRCKLILGFTCQAG